MNTLRAIVLLVVGLVVLWKCADLLVAGAVSLAKRLGVSALVIGLTIVAMGTSAPEVAASIAAVVRGAGDVAIGNVYGSNIANLALVGGLCALIRPIQVKKQTLKRQIPVMLAAALLLWPALHNLYLSRPEGLVLLVIFAVLILLTVYSAKNKDESGPSATSHKPRAMSHELLFVVVGLVGLALGADMAVRGAVVIGRQAGLSEAVIGLTIIAIGTSLPELATSTVAAAKGHHDISIGNLVGSNIFNTLLVVGAAGTVKPFAITSRLIGLDYWIMLAVSAGFAVAVLAGKLIVGRISGTLLVCTYVAFLIYLLACPAGI